MNYVQDYIVDELSDERKRQNEKFPAQHARIAAGQVDNGLMLAILVEEVGEAAKAILEDTNLREELVQIAAVAIAWIEGLDAK